MSPHEFQDEILKLNSKKANVENDIPTKIFIGSYVVTFSHLSKIYNKFRNHHDFPMTSKQISSYVDKFPSLSF